MEGAEVEFVTQGFARVGAEFLDLEFADLISQSLAGPDNVTVNLDLDVMAGLGGVRHEEVDGVLAAPALGMHADIDHQPDRTPHFIGQLTEFVIWVVVHADVVAEAFGIEAPAFTVGGEPAVFAEFREAFHLLGQGYLKMVAGDGLVQGEGDHFPFGAGVEGIGVGIEVAGATGLKRATIIIGGGLGFFGIGRDGNDTVGQARQATEDADEFGVDPFADVTVACEQGLRGVIVELRVGAEEFAEGGEAALEASRDDDRVHLGADAFDLGLAEVEDLIGGHVGGDVVFDALGVPGLTVGEVGHGDGFAAGGDVIVDDVVMHALEGGGDVVFISVNGGELEYGLVGVRDVAADVFDASQDGGVFGVVSYLA